MGARGTYLEELSTARGRGARAIALALNRWGITVLFRASEESKDGSIGQRKRVGKEVAAN